MSQDEILAGLAEIVNEVAGIPQENVKMEKSFFDDLDVDSLFYLGGDLGNLIWIDKREHFSLH